MFVSVLLLLLLFSLCVCCSGSTPVTVLRLHVGLRVEGTQLQERLHFLRGMMAVDHGMFFIVEGGFMQGFEVHGWVQVFWGWGVGGGGRKGL